ncbi:MAG: sensor histidine kinase KdpD [Acidobacteria bacterium]|nr:sensor histidine kinase KdpD [Acidobacteriota bacterium]
MARGELRIFLGAAPGVGKTYSMLEEGRTQQSAGVDVVVGIALDHGRAQTKALLTGLEVIAPVEREYRGGTFPEMDVAAVLARKPAIALVDEYAHSNVPGGENAKRWQDVEAILDAGINVYSTVNVQHLESLADVVESVTGVRQQESVPDAVVRRASQIELVDITPELLRLRMSEGNIYATDKVDAALANYFRLGNLTALRELALLWLADRVEEGLAAYRLANGIVESWPTRERVVVGLTGGPEGQVLIRRAARILSRVSGGEILAVHVRRSDGVAWESAHDLEVQRQLVTDLGGTFHSVGGDDAGAALLEFARSVDATQLVVGTSRRRPLNRLLNGPGVGAKVVRESGDIDVHMVTHQFGGHGVKASRRGDLGRRRVVLGFVMAIVLPAVLQFFLSSSWGTSLTLAMLLQFTGAIAVALVGGLWPAVVAALWSSLLLNFFSTPPVGTLTISDRDNLLALLVFLVVSAAVAVVVDRSARRSKIAAQAGAEAATLSELARGLLASTDTVQVFLEQLREHFALRAVALLRRTDSSNGHGNGWTVLSSAGDSPATSPEQADNVEEVSDSLTLVLSGRVLPASDRRLLAAFGAHVMAMEQRTQLDQTLADNLRLAEGNTMRTAVLRAVSHDLRTPLAGIKLAISSLRQEDISFAVEEEAELLKTVEDYADRLNSLVDNLLDMSRLSSDTVNPLLGPVTWLEVIPGALRGVAGAEIRLELPPNMPAVQADAGMLERVLANIIENAVKYAPDSEVLLVGSVGGTGSATIAGHPASELRIIDRGRGVAEAETLAMFAPFQRLDDVAHPSESRTGVGLGLAVAKGFTEAMGGVLAAEKTPGGGLTMVVRLPLATGIREGGGSDPALRRRFP